jgi:nicotinamidase/pyrazinamidase
MKIVQWNTDTAYDMMRDDASFKGALPVPGAREIEPTLDELTRYGRENGVIIVNTADWHNEETQEISDEPDYQTTFPAHCMRGTKGARFVPATRPRKPYTIDWQDETFDEKALLAAQEIVMYKDHFGIFQGSKHADRVVELLNPDRVVVYGVATNVCVNYAVEWLLERGREVYVITDAIKELPGSNLDEILQGWEDGGATLLTAEQYMNG